MSVQTCITHIPKFILQFGFCCSLNVSEETLLAGSEAITNTMRLSNNYCIHSQHVELTILLRVSLRFLASSSCILRAAELPGGGGGGGGGGAVCKQ